jgi:hypothetical protein
MTTIKKAYVELIQFLEENSRKNVSTILEEAKQMCMAKNSSGSDIGKTFLKDDEGNIIAIYCYYHKKWEVLEYVEYGKKANTASGYNTMCKEGVSNWTKQQRKAKQAKESLLEQLSSGELEVSDLQTKQDEIEETRKAIVEHSIKEASFSTMDELTQWLES